MHSSSFLICILSGTTPEERAPFLTILATNHRADNTEQTTGVVMRALAIGVVMKSLLIAQREMCLFTSVNATTLGSCFFTGFPVY